MKQRVTETYFVDIRKSPFSSNVSFVLFDIRNVGAGAHRLYMAVVQVYNVTWYRTYMECFRLLYTHSTFKCFVN